MPQVRVVFQALAADHQPLAPVRDDFRRVFLCGLCLGLPMFSRCNQPEPIAFSASGLMGYDVAAKASFSFAASRAMAFSRLAVVGRPHRL